MIIRKQKPVDQHLHISLKANEYLDILVYKRLIESKSKFIEKLILKYAPVMLDGETEFEETNLLLIKEELKRLEEQNEASQKSIDEFNNLTDEEKKELEYLNGQLALDGYILSKDQMLYQKFKKRGLIK